MAAAGARLGLLYVSLCALAVHGERPSDGQGISSDGTQDPTTHAEGISSDGTQDPTTRAAGISSDGTQDPTTHAAGSKIVVNSKLHTSTFKDVPDKSTKQTYTLELDTPPVLHGGLDTRNTSFTSDIRLNSVESHEASVVDDMHATSQSISRASTQLAHLQGKMEDNVDGLKEAYEMKRDAAEAAENKFQNQEGDYTKKKSAYQNLTQKTMAELEVYRSLVSEHKSAEDDYVEAWKKFHRLKAGALRANQEANLALARYNRQEDQIKYWQDMLDKDTKEMEEDKLELSSIHSETVAPTTTTTTTSPFPTTKSGAQHFHGATWLKVCILAISCAFLP